MYDPDEKVSIGQLLEQLEAIDMSTVRISKLTTEIYEKQIANEVRMLANVLGDVLVLVREHLSCHDCQVVDHTHTKLPSDVGTGRVALVWDVVVVQDHDEERG